MSIYGFKRSSYRERFPGICLTGFLIAGPMSLRPCISGPRGLASEKLTSNSKRRSCGGSKPMAIISGSHASIGGPCLAQWCDPDLDARPWRVRRNDPDCREFGRCTKKTMLMAICPGCERNPGIVLALSVVLVVVSISLLMFTRRLEKHESD